MAIKIKNQSTGRVIIVKNQNDMFNLRNTMDQDMKIAHDDSDGNAFLSTYNLDQFGDKEKEAYINRFSFDPDTMSDKSVDAPLNPTRDIYYDFGDYNDGYNLPPEKSEFDIENDTDEFETSDSFGDNIDNLSGDEEDSNPDMQGEIRSVTGANLVYKRQTQDGSYDELWIFTIGKNIENEYAIRRAIVSGTDIDPNTQQSDDGSQRAITKSVGNVQFVKITGLPQ